MSTNTLQINDQADTQSNTTKLQENDKHTSWWQLIVRNENTWRIQKLDAISIDLNRLGRRWASDEIETLSTDWKKVERITGLTVGTNTVTIHWKMLVEDPEKPEKKGSIVDYNQPIDRALFNMFFDPSLFKSQEKGFQSDSVMIDADDVIQGEIYTMIKEKYGSFSAMGAKMGVTDIILHFQPVTKEPHE